MKTGQRNEVLTAGGRIAQVGAVLTLVLALALTLVLVAGCGQKDETGSTPQKGNRAMVPASRDTAAVDTTAQLGQESSPYGTSGPPGVHESALPETAALRAGATLAGSEAKPEVSSPFHRPEVPAGEGDYSLQLGSFRNADNARAHAERIGAMGYHPAVEVASLAGQTYHRVVLKGLPNRDEAERLGELIRSQLGITYLIRQQ